MLDRRSLLGAAAGLALALPLAAQAAEPVKIGEINSYSRFPGFTLSYQQGWQLAVEEVNAAGGVLGGRPLEVLSRDDGGESSNAVTLANELVAGEEVALLAGTFLSNVGLAVSDFAKQKEVLFIAAEPLSTKRHLGAGQPLHLAAAAVDLHAERDAGRGRGEAATRPAGRRSRPTTSTASRRSRSSRSCSRRGSPRSSSSRSSGRRSASSRPGRPCRRSPRPSPTRSTTRPSRAISSSSCARARRAGCSRAARW